MKSKYMHSVAIKSFLLIICTSTVFFLSSCRQQVQFLTSSIVPAARGTVDVKKDSNKNYDIQISLSNLSEPDRLQPSKKTYVVWMKTDHDAVKNIGQINSSTGFFSSKLHSSFKTVSSSKPTKIFLTAEDDGGVQMPGAPVILTTDSF